MAGGALKYLLGRLIFLEQVVAWMVGGEKPLPSHSGMTLDPRGGYRVEAVLDENGQWVVSHPTLPGCVIEGTVLADALIALDAFRQLYLEYLDSIQHAVPPQDVDSGEGEC